MTTSKERHNLMQSKWFHLILVLRPPIYAGYRRCRFNGIHRGTKATFSPNGPTPYLKILVFIIHGLYAVTLYMIKFGMKLDNRSQNCWLRCMLSSGSERLAWLGSGKFVSKINCRLKVRRKHCFYGDVKLSSRCMSIVLDNRTLMNLSLPAVAMRFWSSRLGFSAILAGPWWATKWHIGRSLRRKSQKRTDPPSSATTNILTRSGCMPNCISRTGSHEPLLNSKLLQLFFEHTIAPHISSNLILSMLKTLTMRATI